MILLAIVILCIAAYIVYDLTERSRRLKRWKRDHPGWEEWE